MNIQWVPGCKCKGDVAGPMPPTLTIHSCQNTKVSSVDIKIRIPFCTGCGKEWKLSHFSHTFKKETKTVCQCPECSKTARWLVGNKGDKGSIPMCTEHKNYYKRDFPVADKAIK